MTWLTVTEYLCHKLPRICECVSLVMSTSRSFPHSWLITRFVTIVSTTDATSGVLVDRSFVFYVVLFRSLFVLFSFGHCVVCPFVFFLLAIVLSVLRCTDSDYPFDIFKLFLHEDHYLDRDYFEDLNSGLEEMGDLRKSFAIYSPEFVPGDVWEKLYKPLIVKKFGIL
jgi:hypothetical protein